MLQRLVDAAAIAAEIARVRSLSGGALRRRWQAVFGRPPPEQLTADLLRRMIANRVQEEAFGTLDRATLKLLDGLAQRGGSRPAERNLKVGTVLVRDYQGRHHTVTLQPGAAAARGARLRRHRADHGHREHRLDTSVRPTPWLGISDSNFDVKSENSSL